MLPRNLRLSRAHFASTGPEKRAASPHFSVSVRESEGNGGCAVIISKKVAKLSVTRHRLKRRALAVLRPWCSPSRAVVVYARPGSALLPYEAVAEELSLLLARVLGKVR